MISIVLNGVEEQLETPVTVSEYLSERQINSDHVVVEINRLIIDKSNFSTVQIIKGDRVEILRFVGGG
ncbi:MAG: sulfur carrier protein ThiS [Chitinispirillaceae bacterium]|nr:sulfur carrier protein ThiS [Chitinispirillaceae bacterium]